MPKEARIITGKLIPYLAPIYPLKAQGHTTRRLLSRIIASNYVDPGTAWQGLTQWHTLPRSNLNISLEPSVTKLDIR
jgi:hypothetical protein